MPFCPQHAAGGAIVALPFLFAVTAPPSPNFGRWCFPGLWPGAGRLGAGAGAAVVTRAQCVRLGNRAAGTLAWGCCWRRCWVAWWGFCGTWAQSPGACRGFIRPPGRGGGQPAPAQPAGIADGAGCGPCFGCGCGPSGCSAPSGAWAWCAGGALAGGRGRCRHHQCAPARCNGCRCWACSACGAAPDARKAIAPGAGGHGAVCAGAWALPQVRCCRSAAYALMGCSTGSPTLRRLAHAGCCGRTHAAPHSLKPWTGWGGELSYAHYITLFPEERFACCWTTPTTRPCTWR